jgi:fibronectin-binding autotransporter adhesin
MLTRPASRVAIVSAVLAVPVVASAATVTWTGGGTNNNWTTGANWSTNTVPLSTDDTVFGAAGLSVRQPTLSGTGSVAGMQLNATPTFTLTNYNGDFTVTGAVTGGAGMLVTSSATGNFGRLVFSNTGSNFAGGLTVQGTGIARYNSGATINTSFGSSDITLDGGTFSYQGPEIAINTSTGAPTGNAGADRSVVNNIVVTSTGGTLNMNQGSGTGGLAVAFNTIRLGGTLNLTSAGGGNPDGYTIAGTITLQQDVARTLRINNATGHNASDWISGAIVDGAGAAGNPLRLGMSGRTLQISSAASSYAGGTIVEAGGVNRIDVMPTAVLGTGGLTVESGGKVRLLNPTELATAGNLAVGQTISAAAGGAVGVGNNINIADRFTAGSAGVYGIDGATAHSYSLNMSTLGNGRMFLGSITGGTYSGTTLGAGAGSTYRLGGGTTSGGLSNLILTGTNVLTGNNDLIVGSGLNANASYGRTIIAANQDFVGDVTINTDGLLATRVNGGTPFGDPTNPITVFGTIAANGSSGVFSSGVLSNLTLKPGSSVVLDNQNFSNSAGGNNNDRWADTAPVTLNGANFTLTSARSADSSEVIGGVNFNGNTSIALNGSSNTPGLSALSVASLNRSERGVLTVSGQGTLGSSGSGNSQLIVTGSAPAVTNGIVAPWMVRSDANFLTYSAPNGFATATYSGTDVNAGTSTSVINTGTSTLTGNPTVYALRNTGTLSASGTNTPNNTITITSGGYISTGNNTNLQVTLDSGSAEFLFYNALTHNVQSNATANAGQRGGIKTTGGLTKFGGGTLNLTNNSGPNNYAITGGIVIQQGTIVGGSYFNSANGLGGNLLTVNHEGRLNLNDVNTTVLGLAGIGSGGDVYNGSGTVRVLTLNLASGTRSYEGRISQNLGLVKTGGGTQSLSGQLTYAGSTDVNGGVLLMNGSQTDGGSWTVASGATVGGSGSTTSAITLAGGATLSPGNSPGTFSTGSMTLSDATLLAYELGTPWAYNGSNIPSPNDLVRVTGNLTLDGQLNVSGLLGFGTGTYTLFTYTGTLIDSGLTVASLPSGFTGSISIDGTNKAVNLVVIPEPASLALLAMGAMGLVRRRR